MKVIFQIFKNSITELNEPVFLSKQNSVFSKIYEKIIFHKIYTFLLNEQLLNKNQSGFRSSDSCVNQLLSITHKIFQPFGAKSSLEIRSVFLDILKVFDKVWNEQLLHKLNSMGISGKIYIFIESYLSNRAISNLLMEANPCPLSLRWTLFIKISSSYIYMNDLSDVNFDFCN